MEYRACIDELLTGLTADKLALAVEIARIPEDIRGYGHVKERHPQGRARQVEWSDGAVAQPRCTCPAPGGLSFANWHCRGTAVPVKSFVIISFWRLRISARSYFMDR